MVKNNFTQKIVGGPFLSGSVYSLNSFDEKRKTKPNSELNYL